MPPNFSVRLLPTFPRLPPIALDFSWDDFLFKSGVFPQVICVSPEILCFPRVPVFPSILLSMRRDRAWIAIRNDSR